MLLRVIYMSFYLGDGIMKGKKNSSRKVLIIVFVFALLLVLAHRSQAIIYKYVDNKGAQCYTNSLQAVPQKYRAKAVIIDGTSAIAPAGVSGPQIGPEAGDTAHPTEKEPESLFDKAKIVFGAIVGSKVAETSCVIVVSILLFRIIGKAGNALGPRPIGWALRFIIAVLVLFYVFSSYSIEAVNVFAALKEEVLGAKSRIEKRDEKMNKQINELFPEPHE